LGIRSAEIQIQPVHNRKQLRTFIQLPWDLYKDEPNWVPPLKLERSRHFSSFNPYLKHSRWQAWVAYRGGRAVGRISAQIDELHRRQYALNSGHFGLFECENNIDTAVALLAAGEQWLQERQTEIITGPLNFSTNQECGLLVDGFDTPPVVMMPHNHRWYGELLDRTGYTKAKDLYAYWIRTDFEPPEIMLRLLRRYKKDVSLRILNRKTFKQELEVIREIFNDAWSENWGFVPMTDAEFVELGTSLRLFVPEDFVYIAEYKNMPAAFIAALPNLNEVLKELNGSLFPFGFFKLIRSVKRQEIKTGRVALMGVKKELQNTPPGAALAFLLINAVKAAVGDRGIEEVEMSWILEDNRGMHSILESIGGRLYKTYRIYQKELQSLSVNAESAQDVTTLLLAGERTKSGPLTQISRSRSKALLSISGIPVIMRVIHALERCERIGRYVLCGPTESAIKACAALQGFIRKDTVTWLSSHADLSSSVLAGLDKIKLHSTILITTADHALLDADVLDHFLDKAFENDADVSVGLVKHSLIKASYPEVKRTVHRFSDGEYCGCNLYVISSQSGRGIISYWQKIESDRKKPLQMAIKLLGFKALFKHLFGFLSLAQAEQSIFEQTNIKVNFIELPFAHAGIDVDTIKDRELVETVLSDIE